MTLNWTDNATNEVGNVIYRSTDGINFTFVTQTAANATSQNDTGPNAQHEVFLASLGGFGRRVKHRARRQPGDDSRRQHQLDGSRRQLERGGDLGWRRRSGTRR